MKKLKFLTAMLLVALTVMVSAAATTISIDAEVVDNTVVATVSIADNPGIAGYSLRMDFDKDKLVPLKIKKGEIAGSIGIVSNINLTEDLTTLDNVSAVTASTSDVEGDGVMYTVTFSIKDGAKGETELSLFSQEKGALVNADLKTIDAEIKGTKINLTSGDSESTGGGSIVVKPPVIILPDEPEDEPDNEPEDEPDDKPTVKPTVKPEEPDDETTGEETTTPEKPEFTPKKIFGDVNEADWFFADVAYVYEKGLMKGTAEEPELLFSPQLFTNRAMFVTVLYRMEGEPKADKSAFVDVEAGSYYEKAVAWAAENGIVNGMSPTEFGPMNNITREQTAKIIANYATYKKAKIPAKATDITTFDDYSKISSWAVDSLQICADMNIIRGRSDNTIDPQGNTTRAETAAILRRLVEYMDK